MTNWKFINLLKKSKVLKEKLQTFGQTTEWYKGDTFIIIPNSCTERCWDGDEENSEDDEVTCDLIIKVSKTGEVFMYTYNEHSGGFSYGYFTSGKQGNTNEEHLNNVLRRIDWAKAA